MALVTNSPFSRTAEPVVISPSDLSGCRHRAVLRRAFGEFGNGVHNPHQMIIDDDWANLAERINHRIAARRRRKWVVSQLPTVPRIGDKIAPSQAVISPGPNAVEETLEAVAQGTRIIIGAALEAEGLAARCDLLVRMDRSSSPSDARYAPIIITGHSPAREVTKKSRADCTVVSIDALGLATPQQVMWRHRTVSADAQQLALVHIILRQWERAADEIGIIGRRAHSDELFSRCFFFDASHLYPGLLTALEQPIPSQPHRVKECKSCEFHNHCRAQLVERQDISLLLPGDNSRHWKEQGLHTLPDLIAAKAGETSDLAQAWLRGEVALRRPVEIWYKDALAREDGVEIDIDMEAHPSRGTFLWGVFDGDHYESFTDYSGSGDAGRHVAQLWEMLMMRKTEALAQGNDFTVWVYAAQGEMHWLRQYAKNFGGQEYIVGSETNSGGVGARIITMPTLTEINNFIESENFADVFEYVRMGLVGTDSLGLKTIAPLAGFQFSQDGVDGKAAVDLFEVAIAGRPTAADSARMTLEKYNADDCIATRKVREWLRQGAPGIGQTA